MNTSRLLLASLLFGAFAGHLAASTPLYDLSTAVVSGTGQNTWVASTGPANSGGVAGAFAASPSNLTYSWTITATTGTQNTYFIGKFADTTLTNVGDKLTLNFTVTGANIASGAEAFRFGLFDVGSATTGSKVAAENTFETATGYRVDYGPSTNGNNGVRYRQNTTSTNSNLYASATSPLVSDQTPSNYNWSSLSSANGLLEIELLADNQVQITASFGGSSQVSVVSSALYTEFNAVSFFAVGTAANPDGSLSFSNLSVAYTQAIPEPATASLIVSGVSALGALALLGRRRRGGVSPVR